MAKTKYRGKPNMKMKKYVLTGGPCSGKTTLIKRLEEKGFAIMDEIGREIIGQRKHILVDEEEHVIRQNLMFDLQLKRENKFMGNGSEILFLDRGLADYCAYSEHLLGYIPEKIKNYDISERYVDIFILDRLPFEHDGLRAESGDEEAQEIHDRIISSYEQKGYEPVFVPVMPIEERVKFILSKLNLRLDKNET